MFIEPIKTASGLYVVDWNQNYPAWRAWREWYWETFGKRAFPEKMTTLFAWPPCGGTGALAVADWLGKLREEVEKEPRKEGGGPCKALPDNVLPWRGWSDAMRDDVAADEAQRRQHWGKSFVFAPKYAVRHVMGYRYPPPVQPGERRGRNPHQMAAE